AARRRPHVLDRLPEAECAVGDRELGRHGKPVPLQVEEELLPGLCTLAHAVDEADEPLLALGRGADDDQQALRDVFGNFNITRDDPLVSPEREIKHGNVDPLLAEAHMGRNVYSRFRRSFAEMGYAWSPSGDLSREGCDACPCLYRICQLEPTNRHPSKGYGWIKNVIDVVCGLPCAAIVQSEQPINPT